MNSTYVLIILTLSFCIPHTGYAQNPFLKKLERKAKAKIQQRAERKADQAMDKGLDKVEGAIDKSSRKKNSKKDKDASATSASSSTMAGEAAQSQETVEKTPEVKQEENRRPVLFGQKEAKEPAPFTSNNFSQERITDRGIVGKGPFGIESGSFVQKTSLQNEMMRSVQWDTVHFANFGHLQDRHQYNEQHIDMMGMKRKEKNHSQAVHREGQIYSHDLIKDKGFVMENPSTQFYQGMDEEQVQAFASELEGNMNTKKEVLGTERIDGKVCEVLEFTSYSEEGKVMMRTRMWWWKGMVLKSHSRGMGSEIIQETLYMEEGDQNPASRRFQPNPRINYQRFSLGKY